MAPAMVMVRPCILLLLLFAVVVAVAADGKPPKTQQVWCEDKVHYPACYKREDLYCPANCPYDCSVDCVTCTPKCKLSQRSPPPPPPPKKLRSPPPPPPPRKNRSPPPPPPSKKPRSPPPPPSAVPKPPPPTSVSAPPAPIFSPPPPPSNVPILTPNSPSPPPPSPLPSTSPTKAKCMNKKFETCYKMEHTCPPACPEHCEVDCVTCSPICDCNKPGAICQDPRFIGGDGITFYFHGKKDQDFCMLSDSNLHINAHFIGRRNYNMKRDFTWIQSLGILFDDHQLSVGAQKTSTWDDSVDRLALSFDGEPVFLPNKKGAKWQPTTVQGVSFTRSGDANAVVIEVEGNFKIKATVVPITEKDSRIHNYGITEEDCFAHLDLGFKFSSLSGGVDGVLGQTYGSNYVSRIKMGVAMPVLGGAKEFASSNLFSADCAVAKFNGGLNSYESFEYGNLNCASGMDGRGVVCRR